MAQPNPLDVYLHNGEISNPTFAKSCSAAAGYDVSRESISMWRHDHRIPSRSNRVVIERASLGGVPVAAWEGRKRRGAAPVAKSKRRRSAA
jgi:hypothetical protein